VYVQRLSDKKQAANKTAVLSKPEDLPFLAPVLYGYSLKAKLWLEFHVNDMRPVQWNDEAYEHLVYPEEQKDLVLSFVQNHRSSARAAAADGLDDVILGKGRGLVILLSGPPGTGKTLTAEATADQTRRPLFCVQAEDLGTNAAQLGAQLKRAFAMAADWNAVVLLDEADVFMAVRQVSDVARNELVSIFLRELEYFSGTIFLTTNLLANIDQAFRSRVDIHLLFNPLPATAREVLWRKFLSRLPTAIGKVAGAANADDATAESAMSRLDDAALHALSLWDLNGREIKNAVKTVRTWCVCKGYAMDLARLEAGIRVTAPMAWKLEEGEPSRQGKVLGDWTGQGGWGLE
jgi:ATPase family associated with various cellular activities (AAA)